MGNSNISDHTYSSLVFYSHSAACHRFFLLYFESKPHSGAHTHNRKMWILVRSHILCMVYLFPSKSCLKIWSLTNNKYVVFAIQIRPIIIVVVLFWKIPRQCIYSFVRWFDARDLWDIYVCVCVLWWLRVCVRVSVFIYLWPFEIDFPNLFWLFVLELLLFQMRASVFWFHNQNHFTLFTKHLSYIHVSYGMTSISINSPDTCFIFRTPTWESNNRNNMLPTLEFSYEMYTWRMLLSR